eukprot:SAG31_NODE_27128_length_431_cov_0.620482_1_plen_143_part_11
MQNVVAQMSIGTGLVKSVSLSLSGSPDFGADKCDRGADAFTGMLLCALKNGAAGTKLGVSLSAMRGAVEVTTSFGGPAIKINDNLWIRDSGGSGPGYSVVVDVTSISEPSVTYALTLGFTFCGGKCDTDQKQWISVEGELSMT